MASSGIWLAVEAPGWGRALIEAGARSRGRSDFAGGAGQKGFRCFFVLAREEALRKHSAAYGRRVLERETSLELATSTLARLRSTN